MLQADVLHWKSKKLNCNQILSPKSVMASIWWFPNGTSTSIEHTDDPIEKMYSKKEKKATAYARFQLSASWMPLCSRSISRKFLPQITLPFNLKLCVSCVCVWDSAVKCECDAIDKVFFKADVPLLIYRVWFCVTQELWSVCLGAMAVSNWLFGWQGKCLSKMLCWLEFMERTAVKIWNTYIDFIIYLSILSYVW